MNENTVKKRSFFREERERKKEQQFEMPAIYCNKFKSNYHQHRFLPLNTSFSYH